MLRDPLWTEVLAGDRFNSQPCRYLELCHYEDGNIGQDHRNLPAGEVATWLDKGAPKFERPEVSIIGRSRMAVYSKTTGRDGFPDLPLSRKDVERLVDDVGLPTRFFGSHIKLRRIAARFTTDQGQSWVLRNWLFSVVSLRRTRDNTNISLIIVDDTRPNREHLNIDRIVAECIASKTHSLHPFHPILVLADHAMEDYRHDCSESFVRSEGIHFSLGLPVDHLGPQSAFTRSSMDSQTDFATSREKLVVLCGSLKSFYTSLDTLRTLHTKFAESVADSDLSPLLQARLKSDCEGTWSILEYLSTTSNDMLQRMQQIEMKLQWLFPMLHLQLARRDTLVGIQLAEISAQTAIAAKRDSSSMMIIAVLTTLFLPGTYVATLMSSPGYNNWGPDSAWKYWAVTVPVTIAVMIAIVVWVWRLNIGQGRKETAVQTELKRDFEKVGVF